MKRACKVWRNSVELFLSYSDLIFELTNSELNQFARQNHPRSWWQKASFRLNFPELVSNISNKFLWNFWAQVLSQTLLSPHFDLSIFDFWLWHIRNSLPQNFQLELWNLSRGCLIFVNLIPIVFPNPIWCVEFDFLPSHLLILRTQSTAFKSFK